VKHVPRQPDVLEQAFRSAIELALAKRLRAVIPNE